MDEWDSLLEEKTLSQVTQYHLTGEGANFNILVHQVLSGPKKGTWIAVPHLVVNGDMQFSGWGGSAHEALRDCLQKVKGRPFDDLFPRGRLDEKSK
jgi:hypothetical protein